MTIGERFTALLDARGLKQAALAAQFRERALARALRTPAATGRASPPRSRLSSSSPRVPRA